VAILAGASFAGSASVTCTCRARRISSVSNSSSTSWRAKRIDTNPASSHTSGAPTSR
jgi:hypothetical protein